MNTTNSAALAQLLRILSCAEDQARKTGSADDCRTAASYCREIATQAAYGLAARSIARPTTRVESIRERIIVSRFAGV